MKVFLTFDTQLRRNLLILFTAGLLFWSSMASLLPTLPLYVEQVGASKQQIGIVMGSFALGLLIFRSPLGRLADERGRKLVLLIGALVAGVAPLGYLVVKSIPMLMMLRAFHGISIAAFTTGFSALVADLAPPQNRGEIIGYMSLVTPVGAAIGPALGGYLQAEDGYTPLFLTSAGLGWLALLCLSPVVNPSVKTEAHLQDSTANSNSSIWRLLISPRVRIPTVIMFLIGLAFGNLHTFAPLFIKSSQVQLNAGLFFTAGAIASFSARLFTGRASDRLGRGLFITVSLVVYTIAMVLMWQARTSNAFLFASIVEGTASGTVIPMIIAMITDRALPQERGRIFAVCVMGLDLGIAIAAPILGFVAEQMGYRSMFGFTALLTFLGFVIFMTRSSKDLSSSLRFALGRAQDVYALNKI